MKQKLLLVTKYLLRSFIYVNSGNTLLSEICTHVETGGITRSSLCKYQWSNVRIKQSTDSGFELSLGRFSCLTYWSAGLCLICAIDGRERVPPDPPLPFVEYGHVLRLQHHLRFHWTLVRKSNASMRPIRIKEIELTKCLF